VFECLSVGKVYLYIYWPTLEFVTSFAKTCLLVPELHKVPDN